MVGSVMTVYYSTIANIQLLTFATTYTTTHFYPFLLLLLPQTDNYR